MGEDVFHLDADIAHARRTLERLELRCERLGLRDSASQVYQARLCLSHARTCLPISSDEGATESESEGA